MIRGLTWLLTGSQGKKERKNKGDTFPLLMIEAKTLLLLLPSSSPTGASQLLRRERQQEVGFPEKRQREIDKRPRKGKEERKKERKKERI